MCVVSCSTAEEMLAVSSKQGSCCVQVGLLSVVKDLVYAPTVEVLYGKASLAANDILTLQQAFFEFEAGFELAASPVPHILQRKFCAARRHLLQAFRQARRSCPYHVQHHPWVLVSLLSPLTAHSCCCSLRMGELWL